jgi:hypothetical protein
MERLTEDRNAVTWRLFQLGWYANIALAVLSFLAVGYFFVNMWHGYIEDIQLGWGMLMAFLVLALVLLMGAGITRYQARLEGQHLELKLAIREAHAEVRALRQELSGAARNE